MSTARELRRDRRAAAAREFCRVEITGPGISVSRRIALGRLPALLDHLLRDEPEGPSAPPKPTARPSGTPAGSAEGTPAAGGDRAPRGSRPGLRRYYEDKRPSTNPERIAVIARFLEVAEGRRTFGVDDLRRRFAAAGAELPRNFSRDWATAVRRGYLVALSDGHSYQVGSATRRLIDREGPALLPRSAPKS